MSEKALFKTALTKAMAHCSRREICCRDMQCKLQSWGVGDNDNEKIISLLIKENFINEERFARAFVKDKFNYNKWGRIKITSHLRAKKIPEDILSTAIGAIDNELYENTLRKLISGYRRFVKAKNKHDLKARLLRFGLSKGFESSLLYEILNDMED